MTIKIIEADGYGKYDPPVNILCVDADVASLPTDVPAGSKAWTTDGKVLYIFDGVSWSTV